MKKVLLGIFVVTFSLIFFCTPRTVKAEGTYFNIGTGDAADAGVDGINFSQGPVWIVDKYGKYIWLTENRTGQHHWAFSSNQGTTWSQGAETSNFLTRGGVAYDSIDDELHVVWTTDTCDGSGGIIYRRYLIQRDGSNNIIDILRDDAAHINLQMDIAADTCAQPAAIWVNDGSAHGILVASWSHFATNYADVRVSMRTLSMSAADGVAGNWVAPNGSPDVIAHAPAVAANAFVVNGHGSNASTIAVRGGTGARKNDLYLFVAEDDPNDARQRILAIRAAWNSVSGDWNGGWHTPVIVGQLGDTSKGYVFKAQLLTRPVLDPVNDRLYVGWPRWKDDTFGDTWSIAYLDSTDTPSSTFDVYSANGAHSYAPTGDIAFDALKGTLYTTYVESTTLGDNGSIDFRTFNGSSFSGVTRFYSTPGGTAGQDGSADIPILYGGRSPDNRLLFAYRVNGAIPPTSGDPHTLFFGYIPLPAASTPDAPSSLAQYKSNGSTSIGAGAWTNESTVVLKTTISSANASDTLTPKAEVRTQATSFSNAVTHTGSSVDYAGTPVTGVITVTGLADGIYHWQTETTSTYGASSWVPNGGSPDFGVDITAPVTTDNTSASTYTTDAVITLTCADTNGSGCATTYYTTDGSTPTTGSSTGNTITLSTNGTYNIKYFSVDAVGNTESVKTASNTVHVNKTPAPTPTPTPSSSSSSSSNSSSTPTPPVCSSSAPGSKTPWLYSATALSGDSILLYFAAADGPLNHYVLEYGTSAGNYAYGVLDMGVALQGQMTYTVKSLAANTTYYFRVRAGNDCATGNWSNEISQATKGAVSVGQFQITSVQLSSDSESATETTSAQSSSDSTSCQNHTVVKGDTLWSIAAKLLGNGTKTDEIVEQNKSTYPTITSGFLSIGWNLKLNCTPATPATKQQTQTPASYNLNVTVLDDTHRPVSGATVTLHSTPRTATTDGSGVASFQNVEPGDHHVSIAYSGYTGDQSLNLTGAAQEVHLTVEVKAQPTIITKIAVVAAILFFLVSVAMLIALIKKKKHQRTAPIFAPKIPMKNLPADRDDTIKNLFAKRK